MTTVTIKQLTSKRGPFRKLLREFLAENCAENLQVYGFMERDLEKFWEYYSLADDNYEMPVISHDDYEKILFNLFPEFKPAIFFELCEDIQASIRVALRNTLRF